MVTGGILVVDDEEHIRELISQALGDEGYKVVGAENGAAALSLLEKWRPDLILLDLWMPVMDGWQFGEIYARLPAPHAPIVAMTGVVAETEQQPAEFDAVGYLPKPFELDDLLALVSEFSRPNRPSSHAVH